MSKNKVLASVVKNMKKRDADPLSPLIDRYLFERELPENRDKRLTEWTIDLKPGTRPHGRLSPSSIGGCERLAAFKFLGVKGTKKINPDNELVFEDGNWRHHKWQAFFTEMEAILGSETFRCYSIEERVMFQNLYIRGDLDAHIGIAGAGEFVDWVVDFKGINKFGFHNVLSTQEPIPAHVRQLIAYMRARKVRKGILFYDCKDDQRYKIFTIEFNVEEWREVSYWCSSVLDQIQYRKLPPMHKDCDQGTMTYEKCPYRKLCYGKLTTEELERKTYKKFPGLDTLWEEGLEREQD